jgi:hypothetical protein
VRVISLGGDCLPTLSRAVLPKRAGVPPRFEALNEAESMALYEAGDGRVTRRSVLAAYEDDDDTTCGVGEIAESFFGSADHHGIYSEPTFQSLLLRVLLRPAERVLGERGTESLPSAG